MPPGPFRFLVPILIGLLLMMPGGGAAAQDDVVEPLDATSGYDHVSDPPTGAFSSVDWCFSFTGDALIGETIEVSAEGPGGPVTGTGVVGGDGTVKVRVGIITGGDYAVSAISALESGTRIETADVGGVNVVFDPELIDCFDDLVVGPPPTTASSTTTTAPTTAVPTSAESAGPPSTDETAPDDDGSSRWPFTFLAIGVLLLIGGLLTAYWPDVTITSTTRCERERREVARIEDELRRARKAAKELREEEKRLKDEARELDFSRAGGTQRQKDEMKARKNREEAEALGAKADQTEALIKTFEDQLRKAERALAACMKRPSGEGGAPPSAPASTPGPEGISTNDEESEPCCPAGNWIGVNTYGGGGAGYGRDIGSLYLLCVEHPSRMVVMSWSGVRAGIFLGGELSVAVFVLHDSGRHPNELKDDVAKVLSGWDWDISVGVSWTKLLKSGAKTAKNAGKLTDLVQSVLEAGKTSRAIKRAEASGRTVEAARLGRKNKEVLEEMIREGHADDLLDAVAKGSSSGAQAGGSGANIPVGGGLQGGFWKALDLEVDIVSFNGCTTCDPSKQ